MGIAPGRNYVNGVVRVGIHFEQEDGTDVNPTTVSVKVRSPSGAETTYVYNTDDEVSQVDTGDYYLEITPTEAGRWHYRWYTTGSSTTAVLEGDFLVQHSAFYDDAISDYAL